MRFNSLGNHYEGVRLSINVLRRVNAQVAALRGTLTALTGVKTQARAMIAQEINLLLERA